jgi:hypothetical protein
VIIELLLDDTWPNDGFGPVEVVLSQLPDPTTLARGARVAIPAAAKVPSPRRFLERIGRTLLRIAGQKPPRISLAVRCTALLARGYTEVGAGPAPASGKKKDDAVAWATVP